MTLILEQDKWVDRNRTMGPRNSQDLGCAFGSVENIDALTKNGEQEGVGLANLLPRSSDEFRSIFDCCFLFLLTSSFVFCQTNLFLLCYVRTWPDTLTLALIDDTVIIKSKCVDSWMHLVRLAM